MWDNLANLVIFAQGGDAPQPPSSIGMLFPLIAIGFVFYLIIIRPQRRDQAKREAMLKALKKNDRVVTIGGVIGTVANIGADGRDVTLKVDDNTRIKFLRSSIQSVLSDTSEGDSEKSSN